MSASWDLIFTDIDRTVSGGVSIVRTKEVIELRKLIRKLGSQ
jgi:hypothetical protein